MMFRTWNIYIRFKIQGSALTVLTIAFVAFRTNLYKLKTSKEINCKSIGFQMDLLACQYLHTGEALCMM